MTEKIYITLSTNSAFFLNFASFFFGGERCSRYSDSLRAGRSGDRIPVEARFSAPVQMGTGAYPASYTMVTGSFSGLKRPGRGVHHLLPCSAEVKERLQLYLYSLSGPSWPVIGWNLPLPWFKVAVRQPYLPHPPPPLGAPLTRCENPKDDFHVSNLATIQILEITTGAPEGQQIPLCHLYSI
jgi:hypothetical protein